jgi:hypothetical protein
MRATMVAAAVIASLCLGVAISGFTALGELTDPAQIADAKGFAWFWAFLGCIAIAMGVLAWWFATRHNEAEDA